MKKFIFYIFTILLTDLLSGQCNPPRNIQVISPAIVCLNGSDLDLRDYVLVDGVKPIINSQNFFTILAHNNKRNHPKVFSTKLDSGYLFNPSSDSAGGNWLIKFTNSDNGCDETDSFAVEVVDTFKPRLLAPMNVCSSGPDLDLNSIITNIQAPATVQWSGFLVSGNSFHPVSKDLAAFEGPYLLKYEVTGFAGCKSTGHYPVTVQSQPSVRILNKPPLYACELSPVHLESVSKWSASNNTIWKIANNGNGKLTAISNSSIGFQMGSIDSAAGFALVEASTMPQPGAVCPAGRDTAKIIIHAYPKILMAQAVQNCVPFSANFSGYETSGLPNSDLVWEWKFGNGAASNLQNPQNIYFDTEGKYSAQLIVKNTKGNCLTSMTKADFILVFPKPVAAFDTDPSTRSADGPTEFQMINKSTLDESNFSGSLTALWNFGDPINDPDDTSTLWEPAYTYGKDVADYSIELIVISDRGCRDTAEKKVSIIEESPGPYIPSAFTPNGTGPSANEVFKPVAIYLKNYSLNIMSRNGDILFFTQNINEGWDGEFKGKPAPSGPYYYRLSYTAKNGQKIENTEVFFLLR